MLVSGGLQTTLPRKTQPFVRGAVIMGLFLSIAFLVFVEYLSLRQQLADQLKEQLQIVSENVAASILFMDKLAANQILSSMAVNPDIDSAVIFDAKNVKFAFYVSRGVERTDHYTKIVREQSLTTETLTETHIVLPIFSESTKIGYIHAVANLKRLYQHLIWYGCSTAFVLMLTVGIAITILRRLTLAVEEANQKIGYIQSNDPITLLPNRKAFLEYLETKLGQMAEDKSLGVLMFDMDDFRVVNDTLGHHVGDFLLSMVSQRLQLKFGRETLIFRVGGDEFALLIEQLPQQPRLVKTAQRIIDTFSIPFTIENRNLYFSVSVGACLYPQDASNAANLLQAAEVAMYSAKRLGKAQFQLFSSEMHERNRERLGIESELRDAIEQEQFELYYQPQYHLSTGELVGAEALIRWKHPQRGMVSPISFIPIAEETGLIVPIGDWVIRTASAQLKQWLDQGLKPIRVSINLSARQFREAGLIDKFANTLVETDIPPELLELEITESVLMDDINLTVKRLEALRLMGVHLAIDDFGTGYSSLSYLKRFPVSRIKIDRSFIQDIPQDNDDVAITLATINMAHSLGLEVVAEGVETKAQREFLKNYHCEIGQGYLFSKPVDSAFMTILLRTAKHDMAVT